MRKDHTIWSVSLGTWGGIPVRLHMFFLLFGVFTFYISWRGGDGDLAGVDWLAAQSLIVLLASVFLHEIGHIWVASRFGGFVDQIVLGPLGGLSTVERLYDPSVELRTFAAGPIVNGIVAILCVPLLLANSADPIGLMNPIAPTGLTVGSGYLVWVKLTFWINWALFVVNLIPAFPFDGGRILRAAINWQWPFVGQRKAVSIVAAFAQVFAGAVFVLALCWKPEEMSTVIPLQFALILLSIFLFFSAKQEASRWGETTRSQHRLVGDLSEEITGEAARDEVELSQMYSPYDGDTFDPDDDYEQPEQRTQREARESSTGSFRRWLEARRESSRKHQKIVEAADERRADEILQRVHAEGMESLTAEERAVLERVSQLYRNRARNGS